MIKIVSIPELVQDVLAYLESKKKWETAIKFPDFISHHKKKHIEYIKCMRRLEKRYRREYQPKQDNTFIQQQPTPSAPPQFPQIEYNTQSIPVVQPYQQYAGYYQNKAVEYRPTLLTTNVVSASAPTKPNTPTAATAPLAPVYVYPN